MSVDDGRLALPIVDDDQFRERFGRGRAVPHSVSTWNATDSAEAYHRNMSRPATRQLLADIGYDDRSIEYRYNNHGFRSEMDFHQATHRHGTMFVGCSFTEGVALRPEETWCHIMGRRFSGPIFNLGQGGTGIDSQCRLLRAWASYLLPQRVFTLGAFGYRREIVHDDGSIEPIGPWSRNVGDMLVRFYGNESSKTLHTNLCLDAMKQTCNQHGIELWAASDDLRNGLGWNDPCDRGRDLFHVGRASHARIGESGMEMWVRLA